jgi:hypothetical protein
VAVYNTSGTLQAGARVVIGSGTTNASGNLSVTLSGSAAFTGTSYQCTAMYSASAAGTAALAISGKTSTSFTIKGDASKGVDFICIGT